MNDDELFLNYMRQMGLGSGEKKNKPEKNTHAYQEQKLFLEAMMDPNFLPQEDHEITQEGSSPREIKLARKKQFNIEEQIDLHGLSTEEAHSLLSYLIPQKASEGVPLLLVITGKGKNSKGGSILNPLLRKWIRQEGHTYVKYWAVAPRNQGGEGAIVLYLKKSLGRGHD